MKPLLLLILISLSTFIILSPYASIFASMISNPVNISQTHGNIIIYQRSFNPQIATVGENIYVIWQEDQLNADIYFRRSTDGGASFGEILNLSNNTIGIARNPHIAVSGNNVYVTWLQDTGKTFSIFFKRSTDGGASFGETLNLSNITVPSKSKSDYIISFQLNSIITDERYPLVVGSANNVYVIWLDNITKYDVDIFYIRSTDGGASFGEILNLSNMTELTQNPHLVVSENNVYVTWNGNTQNTSGIYFRRSTDGGASFEPMINVINNTERDKRWMGNPQVAVSGSNLYLIYQKAPSDWLHSMKSWLKVSKTVQLFFIASNNTGTSFSQPILLSNNNGVTIGSEEGYAQLYVSGSNVYVVWPTGGIDRGEEQFNLQRDMYLRRSTDEGASFEPIVNLSHSIIKGYSSQEPPRIVANGSNVYIAWDVIGEKKVEYPVLAKSGDGGASFDISINTTGSNTKLSISENNAASLVWNQEGEIFFREAAPTLPLSSLQPSIIQTSSIHNVSYPIVIDGKIGSTEWEDNGIDTISERITSDYDQWDDKDYQVNLASTYDNNNSYFVIGVQGTDFKGGSNLTLMFDNSHNGKLDNGDDILKITRGLNYTRSTDDFEDSFWNNITNKLQKDEDYGGTEDGYAASSFYNDTEVFEVSHPLCSNDNDHDYCITYPDETLGFSLKFEVNNSSTLLFFDKEDYHNDMYSFSRYDMYSFSLYKGVYDSSPNPCPGCLSASAPVLVPPATFILEPFQRLSPNERVGFLDNLTSEEQTELLTSPTGEEVKDFLINKITVEELGDFLINKITAEELDSLFNLVSIDDILNRVALEERKAVSDKLSSFQLTH